MSEAPRQVRAVFSSDAALQEAIAQLELAGFDRAAISLPERAAPGGATPEQGATTPVTDEDTAQMRTLQAGTAGTAAMMVGAGLVIATGGAAAVAVAAGVAAGAAGGGLAHLAARAVDMSRHENREQRADSGELVLSVLVENEARAALAATAMHQAGGTQ